MRKYNYDYEISYFNTNVVVLRYSHVSWCSWKSRTIVVDNMTHEPKYIQTYITNFLEDNK